MLRSAVQAAADFAWLAPPAEAGPDCEDLRRLVHNLAYTFGFGTLSKVAAEIAHEMTSGRPADPAMNQRLKASSDEVTGLAPRRFGI